MKTPRTAWNNFPDVLIHAPESSVKQHPDYHAAKSGNVDAAVRLVSDLISTEQVEALRRMVGKEAVLVSVHAYENKGVNAIPEAFANELSRRLGLAFNANIVQNNVVGHTGADGFTRLARQAKFGGEVKPGMYYVLVDDFVGQGGTLANLRGYIESHGGQVVAAVTLTGKPFSAKLTLSNEQLNELREKHGQELENWWRDRFHYAFDRLTQSEARYLARTPDADTLRNRIVAAE